METIPGNVLRDRIGAAMDMAEKDPKRFLDMATKAVEAYRPGYQKIRLERTLGQLRLREQAGVLKSNDVLVLISEGSKGTGRK